VQNLWESIYILASCN